MGTPCQANAMWHACFPAMTVVPNFTVTGVLAITVSLIALVWAAVFIRRKNGGLILIILSILMLLTGAGFIPPFTGIIAGFCGSRINAPLPIWRSRPAIRGLSFLAKLWPWTLFVFVGWSLSEWILGFFFNQVMIQFSLILFFSGNLGLPVLTAVTGFAHDIHRDHIVDK